jgi:tetratricopeptide (TPR) repeat protein
MIIALAPLGAQADTANTEARALYEKGIGHYDLAEYDAAIADFKKAYELSREPGLLFNIAQAYRLEKDYEHARHFYERYLDHKPDAPNRADVEAQIEKMKEALKAEAAAPVPPPGSVAAPPPVAAPAPPVTPPTAPVAAPPPAPSRLARFTHSGRGRATIALAAFGAAALISSVGTGAEALSIRSRYDAGCGSGPCDGALYSHGRAYAVATDVLLSVGVVAAVAATVVGLVRPRERPVTLGMRF